MMVLFNVALVRINSMCGRSRSVGGDVQPIAITSQSSNSLCMNEVNS